MSSFKVAFLFLAAMLLSVCLQNTTLSADDADGADALNLVSTDAEASVEADLAGPQDQENTEGNKVIHGRVFTVPVGEDHYIPYGAVHGTFTKDGQIVAEFTTDEQGEFTVFALDAGDWDVMAEQERDEVFGSAEVTIAYDVFQEDTLVLFLNKCGLARFPNEFDPSLPLAENKVKYWQYVNCIGTGSKTPAKTSEYSASDAYATACNTCGQNAYDACGSCGNACCAPCGNGLGALGLLGLLGLIGLAHPVPPISRF